MTDQPDPRVGVLANQSVTCRLVIQEPPGVVTWANVHARAGTVYLGTADGDGLTVVIGFTPYEARCLAEYLETAAGAAEAEPPPACTHHE